MSKYKYYFKKPKSEIAKDIFSWLAIAGAVCIAASSPYFVFNLMRKLKGIKRYRRKRYKPKNVYNTFYNLLKEGSIKVQRKNHQIYISLTEKGKKKAGWMQIDALKVKKDKKWDGKWRIIIFDISQLKKVQANAFRGKLKELGFQLLQKSVWIIPYKCKDEVDLLRSFFNLSKKEVRIITADDIEDDKVFKKKFKL